MSVELDSSIFCLLFISLIISTNNSLRTGDNHAGDSLDKLKIGL